jgi:hypothetical protein
MSGFMGGSAYTMSRDIAGGFILVTERSFRGMSPGDLNKLSHEIDRHLRELRGSQVATDETAEVQARARKIQRLNGALTVLRAYRVKQKR